MKTNPISPKVAVAALAGAVATILVWLLGIFAPGVDVPQLVEGAFVVVLTFLGGYLKRDPLREDYIADHDPNLRA